MPNKNYREAGERPAAIAVTVLLALFTGLSATPASAQHLPVIPGRMQTPIAQRIVGMQPGLQDIPVRSASPFLRPRINQAKINHLDTQLESMLASVRPELVQVSKGRLPANLISNLKHIEKLSKQLRRQISP